MDFKVVGSRNGISALQLDNKLGALSWTVIDEAIEVASAAHTLLLEELEPHLEPFGAPAERFVAHIEISPKLIGRVIGKQGETLKAAERESSMYKLQSDKVSSQVNVTGEDEAKVELALQKMKALGTSSKMDQSLMPKLMGLKTLVYL